MPIRIEDIVWDEDNEGHIQRHQVDVAEVEEAIEGRRHAFKHAQRLIILGQTTAGRYLAVVLDDLGDGRWYPVTARDMDDSERRLLQRLPSARRGA